MKKLLSVNYLAETIIRYRPLCIIISLLILAGLAQGLSKINFNPDINAFFPENDTLTTSHLNIEDTYSSMDNAVIGIGVKEGTVFTNEVLSLIEDLKIEKILQVEPSILAKKIFLAHKKKKQILYSSFFWKLIMNFI